MLGHLSRQNNYADLAYETVKLELSLHNIDIDKKDIDLCVADRDNPTIPEDGMDQGDNNE